MAIIEDLISKFFPPHYTTEFIVNKKMTFNYYFGVKELEL